MSLISCVLLLLTQVQCIVPQVAVMACMHINQSEGINLITEGLHLLDIELCKVITIYFT